MLRKSPVSNTRVAIFIIIVSTIPFSKHGKAGVICEAGHT